MSEQPTGATASELERLRDILYGDYARTTSVQLDELLIQVDAYQQETRQKMRDQALDQGNQLEATRQELEEKLAQLTQRVADFEQEMAQRLAIMDDQKANRRELGRMLVAMGQQLQTENQ